MGVRKLVSRVPGSVETWKLLKNLRSATWGLGTRGNIRSLGMDRAEAVRYVQDIFGKIDAVVERNGGWPGKRVLEIGPGDSLGAGVLAIAHGARCYRAIDRFRVSFDLVSERRVFADLIASLSTGEKARVEEVLELTPEAYRIRADRFSYSNAIAIEGAPRHFTERFDVLFSNAVLEHVADVGSSLAAMRELLAPGGVMLHDVDLRSHQRFEKHALHFLEYSPSLWRMMTSHTGEPNRVRLPEYRRILDELGFVDVEIDVRERFDPELVRRMRPRLDESFRSLSEADLSVATFRVAARAPIPLRDPGEALRDDR